MIYTPLGNVFIVCSEPNRLPSMAYTAVEAASSVPSSGMVMPLAVLPKEKELTSDSA